MPSAPQTATAGAFGAREASDEITVGGQLLHPEPSIDSRRCHALRRAKAHTRVKKDQTIVRLSYSASLDCASARCAYTPTATLTKRPGTPRRSSQLEYMAKYSTKKVCRSPGEAGERGVGSGGRGWAGWGRAGLGCACTAHTLHTCARTRVIEQLPAARRQDGGVLRHEAGEQRRRPDGRVVGGLRPRRIGEGLPRERGAVARRRAWLGGRAWLGKRRVGCMGGPWLAERVGPRREGGELWRVASPARAGGAAGRSP